MRRNELGIDGSLHETCSCAAAARASSRLHSLGLTYFGTVSSGCTLCTWRAGLAGHIWHTNMGGPQADARYMVAISASQPLVKKNTCHAVTLSCCLMLACTSRNSKTKGRVTADKLTAGMMCLLYTSGNRCPLCASVKAQQYADCEYRPCR